MPSLAPTEQAPRGILAGPNDLRDFPEWFRDQQSAAWQEFQALPAPTRKDQLWRFSSVDLLDLPQFNLPGALTDQDRDDILKYSVGLKDAAGRMIFANDQLVQREILSEDLKKRGVIFQP